MRTWLIALSLCALALAAKGLAPGSLVVDEGAAMQSARAGHQATPVAGGQVLMTGGCARTSCDAIQASAEIYDPASGRYAAVQPMGQARVSHLAAALIDGRVLVAGGWTGSAVAASTEVYDPVGRRFAPAAPLATPRMDGTATALANGAVLVAGGATATNRPTASVEIYDAATDAMRPAGAMQVPRAHHAAARLKDGRVLVVGGLIARNTATATAEIYDPATRSFSTTGSLHQARCKLAALTLQDGRVMVLAGSTDCNDRQRLATTEIFDPVTGRFEPGPNLLNPRYKIASAAAVLKGGEVVIAGSANDVESWVPGSPGFVQVPGRLAAEYSFSTATALPDGRVLIAGGYDPTVVPTARSWQVSRR